MKRGLKLQKLSDSQKFRLFILYSAGAAFIAFYAAADFMPNFVLSTAERLALLCAGCFFLWAGGALFAKTTGNNKPMRINLWIFLLLYFALFITLTLFDPIWGRNGGFETIWTKEVFDRYIENSLNLVPFRTIREFLFCGDFRMIMVNLAGNLVCLMPLGILLPMISEKQNKAWVFLLTCTVIVAAVEILQFLTLAGSCDIDDLILNVGGAFLIYLFTKNKEAMGFLEHIFLLKKGE